MTMVAKTPIHSIVPPEPRSRRWTKEEYHTMGELGWFVDQRVELLEGEIVEMHVPGSPHCISTDNAAEILRNVFSKDRYWVRMQMPLELGPSTEPQPDIAVVPGPKTSYTQHPGMALLLLEVSDSTLQLDRFRQASLYARAGIADYWIVNLVNRQVEVHRRPIVDSNAPHGYRYADVTVIAEADSVTPLAAPSTSIAVLSSLP